MIRATAISLALVAPPAATALELEACDRTTHVSHGGEAGHRDLGAGRVAWAEWWSQEGVYLDYHVADCASGQALSTRVREERIKDRVFDRSEAGLKIIDRHTRRDAALFSLRDLAADLKHTGEDITIRKMQADPCACAALYPDLQGARTPFELN